MAKSNIRKAQEDATWCAFSSYIRHRDAIRTTGTLEYVKCFTCGTELKRRDSQAGHIIPRKYGAALYNPNVVFAQCQYCNYTMEGNHVLGFLNLCSMVGNDKATKICFDAMDKRSYQMAELDELELQFLYAAESLKESYYEKFPEMRPFNG